MLCLYKISKPPPSLSPFTQDVGKSPLGLKAICWNCAFRRVPPNSAKSKGSMGRIAWSWRRNSTLPLSENGERQTGSTEAGSVAAEVLDIKDQAGTNAPAQWSTPSSAVLSAGCMHSVGRALPSSSPPLATSLLRLSHTPHHNSTVPSGQLSPAGGNDHSYVCGTGGAHGEVLCASCSAGCRPCLHPPAQPSPRGASSKGCCWHSAGWRLSTTREAVPPAGSSQ